MIGRILKGGMVLIAGCLLLIALALGVLQLPWTKNRLRQFVFEQAQAQGFGLRMESIEGDPPFKWTLKNVRIALNETDNVTCEKIRLRIALLPLLRREIYVSYCHIQGACYTFDPERTTPTSTEPKKEFPTLPVSLAFKNFKIEDLLVKNLHTKKQGEFGLQAKAKLNRKGRALFLEGTLKGPLISSNFFIEKRRFSSNFFGTLQADIHSQKAFEPFFTLPLDADFSLKSTLNGEWKTCEALLFATPVKELPPLVGSLTVKMERLELPELKGLDQTGLIDATFKLYADKGFEVSAFSLKNDLLCVKGGGKFDSDFIPQSLSLSYLFPHTSRLVPNLGGIVSGNFHYDPTLSHLDLKSESLEVGETIYTGVQANFKAVHEREGWKGTAHLQALHPTIPVDGNSIFTFKAGSFLDLKELYIKAPETQITGDLTLDLPQMQYEGALLLQVQDLSHFAPLFPGSKLYGKLAGKLNFKEKTMNYYAVMQNLKCFEARAQQLTLEGAVTDLFSSPKGKIAVESQGAEIGPIHLETCNFSSWWEPSGWPYAWSAEGHWKSPLKLNSHGLFKYQGNDLDIRVDSLEGMLLQKQVSLEKPVSAHAGNTSLIVTECKLQLDEGYLKGALDLSPTHSKIFIKSEHFPLDLLALGTSRFTLKGNSSLDISLEGTPENLQGHLNFLLEEGKVLPSGKKAPIETRGSLQAHFDKGIAQIHSDLVASGEQYFELTATLPISYQLYPFKFGIETDKPVAAGLTIEGQLEELFDFVNIGSHQITGLLSTHLLLSRTLNSPALQGDFELQQGSYENYFTGMRFQDIDVKGRTEGHIFQFISIEAKDTDRGSLKGNGILTLEEKMPFHFECQVDSLKIIEFDWLSAGFTGPVKVAGNTESARAEGTLVLTHSDIRIPDALPTKVPQLPVTYHNKPDFLLQNAPKPEVTYPFHYDAVVKAPGQILLSGRGLNCELEGELHVTGQNTSTKIDGSLRILKGKFAFAGKDFTLTQGELSFFPSAYLNLTAALSLPDLMITANLRGPLESPVLTFQSSPALPTSSIVSQILFHKDVSELTAPQAIQLADTIVTLSGGVGPGVLETIRKSLGVDRLNISSAEGESEQVTVQIGKYLTQGVMVTLSQSADTSQVIVEVELKNGFLLQAETQEDNQGKFSLKWNKNY